MFFFTADLSRVFFCDRPFTCFFTADLSRVCFFVTDISHVFLEQTFHIIFFDRPFTFFGGTDFSLFLFATDLSYAGFFDTLFTCVCDRPFFLSFCDRPFTFISFFCDRPFTCFFCCCCRPTTSLSSRVSSKGFKAPLARQGPGKLHIPGPFVVSFIIIRCRVIDGLGHCELLAVLRRKTGLVLDLIRYLSCVILVSTFDQVIR